MRQLVLQHRHRLIGTLLRRRTGGDLPAACEADRGNPARPHFCFWCNRPSHCRSCCRKGAIVAFVSDPVAAGLATSLSRPSANVTGVVSDLGLVGTKRLELMREVRPGANHIAALTLPQYWDLFSGRGQRMYQEHGVRLTCLCVANPAQEPAYRQVFANLGHDRPDFINVFSGPENFTYRELIVGLANEMRVPAMYPARQFVELGGLMSYAGDSDELFRHAARQSTDLRQAVCASPEERCG